MLRRITQIMVIGILNFSICRAFGKRFQWLKETIYSAVSTNLYIFEFGNGYGNGNGNYKVYQIKSFKSTLTGLKDRLVFFSEFLKIIIFWLKYGQTKMWKREWSN